MLARSGILTWLMDERRRTIGTQPCRRCCRSTDAGCGVYGGGYTLSSEYFSQSLWFGGITARTRAEPQHRSDQRPQARPQDSARQAQLTRTGNQIGAHVNRLGWIDALPQDTAEDCPSGQANQDAEGPIPLRSLHGGALMRFGVSGPFILFVEAGMDVLAIDRAQDHAVHGVQDEAADHGQGAGMKSAPEETAAQAGKKHHDRKEKRQQGEQQTLQPTRTSQQRLEHIGINNRPNQ